MLTPQEVKPFLLHEDEPVRKAAVDYLRGSWSQDPQVVPMLLQAYHQYGASEWRTGLAYCHQFVITEQSLEGVLNSLAAAEDGNVIWHLNRAVLHAPIEVLRAKESAVLDARKLAQGVAERIQQRLELSQWSAERLWKELQDYAHRSEDKRYVNEVDHGYVGNLITALAPHETPDTGVISELLESTQIEGGWLEIFLIDLVGERRIKEAIPTLVDRYRVDTDYMLERVTVALGKIGDPEAVRRIRSVFAEEPWDFKNYASSVLGDIKHQESENANLALLETEDAFDIRTMLCMNLCDLFSEAGVAFVRKEVRHGYDRNMVCLEEKLLPVAHVLGIDIPEADDWRTQREEKRRLQAERQAELAELGRRYQAMKAKGVDPFTSLGTATETVKEELTTFRHDTKRVGRNDPCPCGSGKKYKNCCGRKPR
jgi:hypothetical protein